MYMPVLFITELSTKQYLRSGVKLFIKMLKIATAINFEIHGR